MYWYRLWLLVGAVLLTGSCATSGLVGVEADSVEAAPTTGPRPTISVSSFTVAAAKAKEELGDGLQDMLNMALLRTQCCRVLDSRQDGRGSADYVVIGALTEFEPSVTSVQANLPVGTPLDNMRSSFAGVMHQLGIQSATADTAEVGIDVRLVVQGTSEIRNATHIRGRAVSIDALKFTDDSLGSGLEVYSNTPMEAAVRDAIEKAATFIAKSAEPMG